jgi:hypothetical protein
MLHMGEQQLDAEAHSASGTPAASMHMSPALQLLA